MADINSFPIPTTDADSHIDGRVSSTLGGDPTTGNGALLVRGAMLYVESMVDMLSLPTGSLSDGQAINLLSYHAPVYPSADFLGGGIILWDSARAKVDHNGGDVISPTVPWDGTQASLADFLSGVGEADPSGTGCFVRQQQAEVWVEDFGAKGDSNFAGEAGADDWASIDAAVNRVYRFQTATVIYAGRVKFRDSYYRLSKTLNLKQTVHMQGMYGQIATNTGPRLIFAPDASGIIVNRHNTLDDTTVSPSTGGADGSKIEGISLIGRGGTNAGAQGLWLRARAVITNVRIEGFQGNGFQVVASAGSVDPSREGNANNWSASNMRITSCGGNGLYTEGADANAGSADSIDCSANGAWGFYDSSFLGNTYKACHTASNAGGSYKADNANARNAFIGCYTESGQQNSNVVLPSVIIGGLFGPNDGGAFRVSPGTQTTILSRHLVNGPSTSSRDFATEFGRAADEAITWQASGDDTDGLAFYWNEGAGTWQFRHARDVARTALSFTTNLTTAAFGRASTIGPGKAIMPFGVWLGTGTDGRHITYDTAPPSTGEHARGDIVYNTDPVAGGFVGWSCVTGGSPGTWKTFGAISE